MFLEILVPGDDSVFWCRKPVRRTRPGIIPTNSGGLLSLQVLLWKRNPGSKLHPPLLKTFHSFAFAFRGIQTYYHESLGYLWQELSYFFRHICCYSSLLFWLWNSLGLRIFHALTCRQDFAHADSVWNSLLSLPRNSTHCLGMAPVSPVCKIFSNPLLSFLPCPTVTPWLCQWSLLQEVKELSVYHCHLCLEEQLTPPGGKQPSSLVWTDGFSYSFFLCPKRIGRQSTKEVPWIKEWKTTLK